MKKAMTESSQQKPENRKQVKRVEFPLLQKSLARKEKENNGGIPPYHSNPVLSHGLIAAVGISFFVLALICPPLILLFTLTLTYFVPQWFQERDDGTSRRSHYAAYLNNQGSHLLDESVLSICESYWTNQRGMCLFTSTMMPKEGPIHAVLFYCHDYANESLRLKQKEHQLFVEHGIACVYIQYEGHGCSDGPLHLVLNWDALINDVASYFHHMAESKRLQGKAMFLMGEGLGGAVAYDVYNRLPYLFQGVVFWSPTLRVNDDRLPRPSIQKILWGIVNWEATLTKWVHMVLLPGSPVVGNQTNVDFQFPPAAVWMPPYIITARTLEVRSISLNQWSFQLFKRSY
jgi:pimeloyl-ACP methyl ester carboxylesterase